MQNLSEDYTLEHVLRGEIRLPAGEVPTPFLDSPRGGGRGEHGVPADSIELLTYLFSEVVDGRNSDTTDDVRRALNREPRDFADYARETAASGVWNASAVRT